MDAPIIYKQWVEMLDIIASGDSDKGKEALDAMKSGTLQWQTGVADRFLKVLVDTINIRISKLNDTVSKNLGYAKNENDVVSALLFARKEYQFLEDIVSIPAIPDKQKNELIEMIRNNGKTMQSSLEDSAKNDTSGKLLNIIKNNRVVKSTNE
ncbi:hypothetical protein B6U63_08415 [Ligilactobacillus salivarius]|uniref:hypothetical protein n=1 Tax=Ligilactobacillus salivarius TaxID=1624 RepID=UPI0009D9A808|nr:hypothetical protein [Ligilactobacillus salivarius]OQQ72924.1 hypothetical protein B6U63_08415 [Ligilactobacillus salivarius]PHY95733.1 hypothetical protein CR166_08790 [Ligilactobacillus salivarius]